MNATSGLRPVVKDLDKVNILLIDDQPAKLLSYEVILGELALIRFSPSSARMTS